MVAQRTEGRETDKVPHRVSQGKGVQAWKQPMDLADGVRSGAEIFLAWREEGIPRNLWPDWSIRSLLV